MTSISLDELYDVCIERSRHQESFSDEAILDYKSDGGLDEKSQNLRAILRPVCKSVLVFLQGCPQDAHPP